MCGEECRPILRGPVTAISTGNQSRTGRYASHRLAGCWKVLCVHYDTSLLPFEVSEHCLRGTIAVGTSGINFIVTMFLESIKNIPSCFQVMYSSLFGTGLAECHCSEDDINRGLLLRSHCCGFESICCDWREFDDASGERSFLKNH